MRTRQSLKAFVICIVLLAATSALAHPYKCTSAIASNFNGTAIAAGDYVWFNAVLKVNGLGSEPATIFVTHASITFTANNQTYTLTVPDSQITLSSSITLATTAFTKLSAEIGSPFGWRTKLQASGLAGNDYLAGLTFTVPASGLPGGIKNVIWQGTFSSDTSGLTVNWQWGAAAYTSFDTKFNNLGVKPVDDNKGSQYQNSDHAGTPESFKTYVTGGATGGGGSNFTGSYSGTGSCALVITPTTSFTVGESQ
jgi:hypothetical protein